MKNDAWMRQALEVAREAEASGEVPIGAVIIHHGCVIAVSGNRVEQDRDPTAHAELMVLREASRVLATPRLTECDLFVTLEPCPMCAQAISFARVRRLVFGAYDPKGGGVEHGPRIFQQSSCHHTPDIIGGVMEEECSALLTDFFVARR